MVLDIRVIPKSGRSLVKENPDGSFKVYLTRPAIEGEANEELVKLMAEYFKVKKYLVSIIKGKKGRNKIVRITS